MVWPRTSRLIRSSGDLEEFCNGKEKLEAYYKEVVAAPSSMSRGSSSTSSSAEAGKGSGDEHSGVDIGG